MWKPETRDLETIASMMNARSPVAAIAAALNVSEADFRAWTARLAAGRAYELQEARAYYAAPLVVPERQAREARIVADRVFEGAE